MQLDVECHDGIALHIPEWRDAVLIFIKGAAAQINTLDSFCNRSGLARFQKGFSFRHLDKNLGQSRSLNEKIFGFCVCHVRASCLQHNDICSCIEDFNTSRRRYQ